MIFLYPNVIVNGALIVRNGNHYATDPPPPPGVKWGHAASRYTTVACNQVSGALARPERLAFLGVGTGIPGAEDQGGRSVVDVVLAENTALVEYGDQVGTRVRGWKCHKLPAAVRLTAQDVGPQFPEAP